MSEHSYTFIFLHGLGGNSESVKFIADLVPDCCKVVLPTAPNIKLTINEYIVLPGWVDIMVDKEPQNNEELYERYG